MLSELGPLFRHIVEAANDVVIITKADTIDPPGPEIVYVNKAFEALTGYQFDEVVGKNPRILQGENIDRAPRNKIRQALSSFQPVRTTLQNVAKDGTPYWLDVSIIPLKNRQGDVTHFAAIERDVTSQREHQEYLEMLSRTDGLTGLLNHRAFHLACENQIEQLRRSEAMPTGVSILLLDIDHFKGINDTFGHLCGDGILKEMGRLIRDAFRKADFAGRVGGEEFCVVLPDTGEVEAKAIAERFRRSVQQQIFSEEYPTLRVTVSVGIATHSGGDEFYLSTLKHADLALYEAKKRGRNTICLHSEL
ncbi:diguanylate cyclase [Aestuariibacter sp. AA17]|uniref:Diguanylate cyclase n=1 Tax=Fluctibacter corallii TaxID=2984329 RepID=A0ABT3A7V5_9ALTE|nr:diguanylate cyclase [Aestuariibacter sp. AA17]MCV2884657.1 diguanylate cyclase [Aestuariibacter sp. AA17]